MSVCGADNGSPQGEGRPPQLDKPDCRLPRRLRIADSAVFREAFDQDVRFPGRYMVLWVRRGTGANRRLGVVASRRSFRRAVDRGRAKRLLREAYRLNRQFLHGDLDVILLARPAILAAGIKDVEKDFLIVARRAGLRHRGQSRAAEADSD